MESEHSMILKTFVGEWGEFKSYLLPPDISFSWSDGSLFSPLTSLLEEVFFSLLEGAAASFCAIILSFSDLSGLDLMMLRGS